MQSLENIVEDVEGGGVLLVVALALVDTRAHQARVPPIHIAADDNGLRIVANHNDILG